MRPAAAMVLLLGLLRAQEPGERTVAVRVTSAVVGSVYLDHGRDVGLRVGDRVLLFPPGGGELEVVVRALSQTTCRAEVPPGAVAPPPGTTGEARVAATAPSSSESPQRSRQDLPSHPPWQRRESPRDPQQPLLVPAFGRRPDERPVTVDGRWFGTGQWNTDGAGDYSLLRSGLRLDARNLLGTGERLRLSAEGNLRHVDVAGGPVETDRNARLDLASVAFGLEHYAPLGVEVGRFLSPHLPELGLIDGAEAVLRTRGGLRFGVGGGAYPRPFPARDAGDDIGVHAFVDYARDDGAFAATVGVQKTWHRGTADRDLMVLRSAWRPAERWSLHGSARLDYYTGSERVLDAGVELTEVLVQARYAGETFGGGASASRFSWPDLRRVEYLLIDEELVRNGEVDRVALDGWWRPTATLSLRASVARFEDQRRVGSSWRGSGSWRDVVGTGATLVLSGFYSDGSYSSGPGATVALRRRFGRGSAQLGYRWHRYRLDRLVTGPERYLRQSAELRLSWPVGDRTDVDLSAEHWFGDAERAYAVGFYVQWRF